MKPIWQTFFWAARHVLGWLFIVLGILGLFLPILQGILFLCIGVLLLADDIPLFKRLIDKVESKWPRTRGPLETARRWMGRRP
jgi:uncharacterized protein